MGTHNVFSLRNKKNVYFLASESWLDKLILTLYLPNGQVIKYDNFTTLK